MPPKLSALCLADMATADPECDLARAIARGDLRFVGIYGYSLSVPCVAGGAETRIVEIKGINPVEGTSDYITSAEQERLQSLALRYAGRYNTLLLDRLRHGPDPDMVKVRQEIEAELTQMERGSPTADAQKAIHGGDSRLLALNCGDSESSVPGLTREQSEERPLHALAFSPDLATEEQTQRMRKLLGSYVMPYNRIVYKAVPRRHFR